MTDYVSLPSEQLSNLVKRYIQFRKATELESKRAVNANQFRYASLLDRIQSDVHDGQAKSVLAKMETLHERVRCSWLTSRDLICVYSVLIKYGNGCPVFVNTVLI